MFGESESESPRVPSPWDNLISSPPSPAPKQKSSPSPLAMELIPRLVPEADDGNVEYKLQLLDPSPARFARLVTQMKWRLLEGGGQAYYELGVADSGELIGLPRDELERSLETLEMMAGEIGASVIVVKEIEVPAAMARLAKRRGDWRRGSKYLQEDDYSTTTTETDPESAASASEDAELEDMSLTVVLDKADGQSGVFAMDSESEESALDDDRLQPSDAQSRFAIDLEISSVFKPRPVRTRIQNQLNAEHLLGGKNKRAKKYKNHNSAKSLVKGDLTSTAETNKAQTRRQGRDRRREEKRKALEVRAMQAVELVVAAEATKHSSASVEADPVLNSHGEGFVPLDALTEGVPDLDDDDDVFASPTTAVPSFPTFSASSTGESHLDIDTTVIGMVGALMLDDEAPAEQPRLIVEALVVRKISLEEAFLDFGAFSLT